MNTPGMKSWIALAVVAVLLAALLLLGSNYFFASPLPSACTR
jgi:hypothetical protein